MKEFTFWIHVWKRFFHTLKFYNPRSKSFFNNKFNEFVCYSHYEFRFKSCKRFSHSSIRAIVTLKTLLRFSEKSHGRDAVALASIVSDHFLPNGCVARGQAFNLHKSKSASLSHFSRISEEGWLRLLPHYTVWICRNPFLEIEWICRSYSDPSGSRVNRGNSDRKTEIYLLLFAIKIREKLKGYIKRKITKEYKWLMTDNL